MRALDQTASAHPEGGVWQDAGAVVMRTDAVLPDRCVRCGEPSVSSRLAVRVSRYRPVNFLVLLVPMVADFVHLPLRKSAVVEMGLCRDHRSRRARAIAGGVVLAMAALLALAQAALAEKGGLWMAAALGLLLFAAVWVLEGTRLPRATRIDGEFVWLRDVHPAVLATLPVWRGAEPPGEARLG